MSTPTTRTVLDRFSPRGKIGTGSLGAIYAAVEHATGKTVALQVAQRPADVDLSLWERATAQSAQNLLAAQSLEHPNIAPIYEFGEDQGLFYLAYEWGDAESCAIGVARGEPLPFEDATRIVMRAGFALQHADAEGIRHGALRPDCLMLHGDTVQLLGFGLCHWPWGRDPIYQSPEDIRGGSAGLRSDLFVLGMLWYVLASGRHPFAGANAAETRRRIVEMESPDLPTAPFYLQGVIHKLLAKDTGNRYTNWSEVAMDISSMRPQTQELAPAAPEPTVIEPAPDAAPVDVDERFRQVEELRKLERTKDQLEELRRKEQMRARRRIVLAIPAAFFALSLLHRVMESSLSFDQAQGDVRRQSATMAAPAATAGSGSAEVGDLYETGPDGHVRIRLGDGSRLALGPNSTLRIWDAAFHAQRLSRSRAFLLSRGVAAVHVASRPRQAFDVETPTGRARTSAGDFLVQATEIGKTEVTVVSGKVDVGPVGFGIHARPTQHVTLTDAAPAIEELSGPGQAPTSPELEEIRAGAFGDIFGGMLQSLDDLTFTQLGDGLFAFASGWLWAGPDPTRWLAYSSASTAMNALKSALERPDTALPETLDAQSLATLQPGGNLQTQLLSPLKSQRLEFYHRAGTAYEAGARLNNEAGTLIVLRNGKVSIAGGDDLPE